MSDPNLPTPPLRLSSSPQRPASILQNHSPSRSRTMIPSHKEQEQAPPLHYIPPNSRISPSIPLQQNEEIDMDDDGIIRCICGSIEDDGYTIQCENCLVWQHVACVDVGGEVPEKYLCDLCNPRWLDIERAKLLQAQITSNKQSKQRTSPESTLNNSTSSRPSRPSARKRQNSSSTSSTAHHTNSNSNNNNRQRTSSDRDRKRKKAPPSNVNTNSGGGNKRKSASRNVSRDTTPERLTGNISPRSRLTDSKSDTMTKEPRSASGWAANEEVDIIKLVREEYDQVVEGRKRDEFWNGSLYEFNIEGQLKRVVERYGGGVGGRGERYLGSPDHVINLDIKELELAESNIELFTLPPEKQGDKGSVGIMVRADVPMGGILCEFRGRISKEDSIERPWSEIGNWGGHPLLKNNIPTSTSDGVPSNNNNNSNNSNSHHHSGANSGNGNEKGSSSNHNNNNTTTTMIEDNVTSYWDIPFPFVFSHRGIGCEGVVVDSRRGGGLGRFSRFHCKKGNAFIRSVVCGGQIRMVAFAGKDGVKGGGEILIDSEGLGGWPCGCDDEENCQIISSLKGRKAVVGLGYVKIRRHTGRLSQLEDDIRIPGGGRGSQFDSTSEESDESLSEDDSELTGDAADNDIQLQGFGPDLVHLSESKEEKILKSELKKISKRERRLQRILRHQHRRNHHSNSMNSRSKQRVSRVRKREIRGELWDERSPSPEIINVVDDDHDTNPTATTATTVYAAHSATDGNTNKIQNNNHHNSNDDILFKKPPLPKGGKKVWMAKYMKSIGISIEKKKPDPSQFNSSQQSDSTITTIKMEDNNSNNNHNDGDDVSDVVHKRKREDTGGFIDSKKFKTEAIDMDIPIKIEPSETNNFNDLISTSLSNDGLVSPILSSSNESVNTPKLEGKPILSGDKTAPVKKMSLRDYKLKKKMESASEPGTPATPGSPAVFTTNSTTTNTTATNITTNITTEPVVNTNTSSLVGLGVVSSQNSNVNNGNNGAIHLPTSSSSSSNNNSNSNNILSSNQLLPPHPTLTGLLQTGPITNSSLSPSSTTSLSSAIPLSSVTPLSSITSTPSPKNDGYFRLPVTAGASIFGIRTPSSLPVSSSTTLTYPLTSTSTPASTLTLTSTVPPAPSSTTTIKLNENEAVSKSESSSSISKS